MDSFPADFQSNTVHFLSCLPACLLVCFLFSRSFAATFWQSLLSVFSFVLNWVHRYYSSTSTSFRFFTLFLMAAHSYEISCSIFCYKYQTKTHLYEDEINWNKWNEFPFVPFFSRSTRFLQINRFDTGSIGESESEKNSIRVSMILLSRFLFSARHEYPYHTYAYNSFSSTAFLLLCCSSEIHRNDCYHLHKRAHRHTQTYKYPNGCCYGIHI